MLIAAVHIANLNEFHCKILFFFFLNWKPTTFYLINNNILNFYNSKKKKIRKHINLEEYLDYLKC